MKRSDSYSPLAVKFVTSLAFTFLIATGASAQRKVDVTTQIAYESGRGTIAVKHAADGTMYVLNKFDKCIWVFDSAGKSKGRISSFGQGPSDLLEPYDFAVNRAGNVIVADSGDVVKVFNQAEALLASFNFRRPRSVGVLSDGSILVSGFPTRSLISVFTEQGALVRTIGKAIKADPDPPMNAFLNFGTIVVDEDDNIYYVFRYLLTPTVQKYSRDGTLLGEWHPEGVIVDKAVKQAQERNLEIKEEREKYGNPARGAVGGSWILSCAAFDSQTRTLWVAVGNHLLALDANGRTVGRAELVLGKGDAQPYQMNFFGSKARFATFANGVFEVDKQQLKPQGRSSK